MRILVLLLSFASLVLSNPASARDGAMYVGGDFGSLVIPNVDIVIKNGAGAVVARAQTNSKGKFLVELASGNYTVEIPGAALRRALDKVSPNGPAKYAIPLHLALASINKEVANLSATFSRSGPVAPLIFKVTIPAMR